MATEKTEQVMKDIAIALADADAQLPTARELVTLMQEAGEDTAEVKGLLTEIEARIRQWTRVLERQGIPVTFKQLTETK